MWNGKSVSVVLPAFNEEIHVRQAVEEFFASSVVDEVLVVDNNSTDRTASEARTAQARVVREIRQGYGAALRRGLREATGDLVVLSEPDGTFVALDILKLLAYCEEFDLVLGTRTTREMIWKGANMRWHMRTANAGVAKFLELLHNTPSLSDCGCTLRLIRKEALRKILPHLTVTGSHFLPEMVLLARKFDLRMVEIPVNYRSRKGVSKITGSLRKAASTALRMIGLILLYRFKRLSIRETPACL